MVPGLSTSSSSSLSSSTSMTSSRQEIDHPASSSSSSTSTPMTSSTEVYLQLLQVRLPQNPRLLQVRKLIIQITIHQSSQVKVWIDKHGETRSLLKHQKSCYMNQTKSQNQIKTRITNRLAETRIQTYQNGCMNSKRILWMREFLNTETHTRVLLMNHL